MSESELRDGECSGARRRYHEWIEERNWFFRSRRSRTSCLALYDERPDFVLPDFRGTRLGASSRAASRTSALPGGAALGRPDPLGPEQVV